ncbi:MAG: trigger factor [Dehalococcoidia bacterium]|nr:trigger factor [Dehalococcoidia bacterium]
MKVTAEKMEHRQVALIIEVEHNELEKSREEAYHRLVGKVSIPGFRKGKAPRAVLEQHVGKESLLEEALEQLMPQLYQEAVKSQGLEPIAKPQIEITQTEPVVFQAIVPLKPTVELGDYHDIKVKPEPVEIGNDGIETAMEQIRQKQAVLSPVDRPVQFGDSVTIDIEASVDGKTLLDHKGIVYDVDQNSAVPLLGFAENLIGVEKNREKIFALHVPDDYGIKEFGGKECLCKVAVSEIKEKELPDLSDELAQTIGYDNLTSLHEKVAADLRAKAEQRSHLELRQKVLDAIIERSSVDYPPILEEREIAYLLEDEARRLGYTKIEDYLDRANRTVEELKQQLRPVARKRVINTLIIDKVAEQEEIEITSSEVDNKIEEMTRSIEDKEKVQQIFALPRIRESIKQSLRTEKTVDRLVQIATGNKEG